MHLFGNFIQVRLLFEILFDILNCLGDPVIIYQLLLFHLFKFRIQICQVFCSDKTRNLLSFVSGRMPVKIGSNKKFVLIYLSKNSWMIATVAPGILLPSVAVQTSPMKEPCVPGSIIN